MSKPKAEEAVVDVDDLTEEQIDERVAQTLQYLVAIKQLWRGLVRLPEQDRKNSSGRNLSMFSFALKTLFSLLIDKSGKDTPLGKLFHVLGDEDRGEDPERFEPQLLLRRIRRVEAQQKIVEELKDIARHLGDDVLNTSEMVLAPGLLALDLARTLSKGNASHRSALAPVLDALRDMTKKARQRKAAQRDAGPSGGTL